MPKIVFTPIIDDAFCNCSFCNVKIAALIDDIMTPSADECYLSGNIAIPNFGWFCSLKCALDYEVKFDVRFKKSENGNIDYYSSKR